MAQWNSQLIHRLPICSYFVSHVFIKNLIYIKSKHKKQNITFILYCPGRLAFIYNMYKSMNY